MSKQIVIEQTIDNIQGMQNIPFNIAVKVAYISNDSATYALRINFDKTTDELGTFTLNAGEIASDIPVNCSTISLKGVGGSVPVRILGV